MKEALHPEYEALVLTPASEDPPEELEDLIHSRVFASREGGRPLAQVIVDLSEVESPAPWLKALGPGVPDANLRVVLGPKDYVTARALQLHLLFEWYPGLEAALRGGA